MTAPHPRAVAPSTPWLLTAIVLLVGTVVSGLVDDVRAALSFGGAFVVASLAFALGAAGIRAAGRLAPFAAMIAAIGGYGITVLLFALVYAVADPDVVTFPAVAAGLLCAVGLWVFASIRSLSAPVNDDE